MNLPDPPHRGSFWSLGNRPVGGWDVGVKLLVWGAVLATAIYLAWAIS